MTSEIEPTEQGLEGPVSTTPTVVVKELIVVVIELVVALKHKSLV